MGTLTCDSISMGALAPNVPAPCGTPVFELGGGVRNNAPIASGGRLAPAASNAFAQTYYALHVTPGHEGAMARRIARLAGSAVEDVFSLQVELERKRAGVWRVELEQLYPGYLFISVADLDGFERSLKLSASYQRLLGVGGKAAALTSEEAEFVGPMAGPDHVLRMSGARLVRDRLQVFSGPLTGRESMVKSFNRRKRLAWLDTGFSRGGVAKVGLDIVSKT